MLQKRMVIHAFHLVDRQLYCHPIERLSILFRSELLVCGSSTLCKHCLSDSESSIHFSHTLCAIHTIAWDTLLTSVYDYDRRYLV